MSKERNNPVSCEEKTFWLEGNIAPSPPLSTKS